jgi:hypothetical protein
MADMTQANIKADLPKIARITLYLCKVAVEGFQFHSSQGHWAAAQIMCDIHTQNKPVAHA